MDMSTDDRCSICKLDSPGRWILCRNCLLWVHAACLRKPKHYPSFTRDDIYFLCFNCSHVDENFNFNESFGRIQAQNFTTESVISEKALFDVHGHCLPQVQVYQSGNECNTARSILDHYVPEVARRYSPLVVLADGNCFFRAASRTLFGTEQYHCALRLSCADEVAQHLPFYDENSEPAKLAAIDGQNLLTEISTLGGWQTIASAFALSGVLGIPLQTFYPEVCHREMPRLSRSVYGRNVRRQKTAQHCIMFSACAFNGQDFNFDHYVPLVERQEEDVMEVVGLSRKQHYVSTKNTTNINSEMHVGTANYQETMLPSFVDDPIGLGLLEEEEEIRNLTEPQPEVSTKISSSVFNC